jgi:putative membrane protein
MSQEWGKPVIDFLKGLVIGMGAVAPGVSGGTLAVILGIYEKITHAIANLFHEFWKKVKGIFPFGFGGAVGVLGFSNIINYLFNHYEAGSEIPFYRADDWYLSCSAQRQADRKGL